MAALATLRDTLEATLSAYLTKQRKLQLTNEMLGLSYAYNEMIAANSIKLSGGDNVAFDAILDSGDTAGFVEPYEVRQVKEVSITRQGTTDWSFFEASWSIEKFEQLVNKGEAEIYSIADARQEDMKTTAYNALELAFWHQSGYGADTSAKKKINGPKFWITRTGLAYNGGASVAGIDTSQFPRWKSRYAGPLGSNLNKTLADSTAAADQLTSANQLLDFMARAMRYCNFQSPNDAALKFAQADVNDKQMLKRIRAQKIYADEIGYSALEKLLNATRDDMTGQEVWRSGPVFRGVPVQFIEHLGLDANGVPTESAGGGITAGTYPNTGEVFFINMMNFKPILHQDAAPQREKLELIPLQQVLWQLYTWMLSVVCNSRQRQCVLWGFSPLTAA